MRFVYGAILLPLHFLLVTGFRRGAPNTRCDSMKTAHGQQVDSSADPNPPYQILLSQLTVSPGGKITVTINATRPGVTFKGFFAQAVTDSNKKVGTFEPGPSQGTQTNCEGVGITHTSNDLKTEVSATWVAPLDFVPTEVIHINATVVANYSIYWYGVQSQVIQLLPSPNQQQGSPMQGGSTPVVGSRASGGISLQTQALTIPADPECGKTKGCFHDCGQDSCSYLVTWQNLQQDIAFDIKFRPPGNNDHQKWMAIGFSKDFKMGDDSVTECLIINGKMSVFQSYNLPDSNVLLDDRHNGISEESGSFQNGILHCSFRRAKSIPSDWRAFDLNEDWYMMFAEGEAIGGNKFPHRYDVLPPVTAVKVDLQSNMVIGRNGPLFGLVKAHGVMMLLSWVIMVSIAMMAARYGKELWPSRVYFGVKLWFNIHRTFMVLVLGTTILSFLIILVEAMGYSKIPVIPGKMYHQLHPILGFIVVVLTLTNPIMALFRPGTHAPGRIVFNWSHWGVGVLAYLLAVTACLIGLDLGKSDTAYPVFALIWTFVVFQIFFVIFMETFPFWMRKVFRKFKTKRGSFEMTSTSSHSSVIPSSSSASTTQLQSEVPEFYDLELNIRSGLLIFNFTVVLVLGLVAIILFLVMERDYRLPVH